MTGKANLISYIKGMRLHFLLGAAFAAALYPLDALLCTLSGRSGLRLILLTVLPVLLVWMGMLTAIFLRRMYRKRFRRFRLIVWSLTAVIASLCWMLLPLPVKLLRLIYCAAACGSFYGGIRFCYIAVEDLTGPYVFTALCLWNVLVCGGAFLLHASFSLLPVVLILTGTVMIFAVIRNRIALESILHGRDGELWELPREIRSSNTGLLFLLCGIGTVLICCCRWLAKLLLLLWNIVTRGALRLFTWLMSQGGGDVPEESVAEELSSAPMPIQENGSSAWLRILVYAVLFAGLLGLIFWKRREIADGFLQLWRSLCRWVREKLNRSYGDTANEAAAYCDYVEDLLTAEQTRSDRHISLRKKWKRHYRQYCRMPENAARYRMGYGLALERLPEELCMDSDSVEEILQKLHEQGCMPEWDAVSECYNHVRYGEQLPAAADFMVLNSLLKKAEQGDF